MSTTHEPVRFWEIQEFWVLIVTVIIISIVTLIFIRATIPINDNDNINSTESTICKNEQNKKSN